MNLSVEIATQPVTVEVASPATVTVELGATGPTGLLPRVGYVHTQGTPAAVWTIDHGLPFYPNVTVVDSSGSTVVGDITYADTPSPIILTFSAAFSGTAYLS